MQLRPYQTDAINSIYSWFAAGKKAPLIVTPTGSGKSVILAEFIRGACESHPDTRILVITHVKELVEQDADAIVEVWPKADVGVYSAGLKKRQFKPITVASIQSIYKKPEFHGSFDLIIVDEAHLIPHKSDGMYRQLLDSSLAINPLTKIIGLTATPFRLDHGLLHEGKLALFDGISYEANVGDLIKAGYLTKLVSQHGDQVNLDQVKKVAGEFNLQQLDECMSVHEVVDSHADIMIERCADRKYWLIFAVSIKHAELVCQALRDRGIAAAYVTGAMDIKQRDAIIESFKNGKVQALVNCMILTTGFNFPDIDAIVMLRPTLSAGLYVQMVGRGLRTTPTKKNCLVLDFGGNVMRHGFIDAIEVNRKKKGAGGAPVKRCPECETFVPISVFTCDQCGYEFPQPKPVAKKFDLHEGAIVSIDVPPVTLPVKSIRYTKHVSKKNGKATLKVSYFTGFQIFDEYVCLEHDGFARKKAREWWQIRASAFVPNTVDQALIMSNQLREPQKICLNMAKKFPEITQYHF